MTFTALEPLAPVSHVVRRTAEDVIPTHSGCSTTFASLGGASPQLLCQAGVTSNSPGYA